MRLALFVMLVLLGAGAIFGGLWYSQKSTGWHTFSDPATRVVFEYPPSLVSQPIREADLKDKIIFRASEQAGDTPVLVTLRYEDGLRVLTNLVQRDLLDILVGNSDTMHPERFPGYQKISQQQFERHGKKASETIFTYRNPAGERIKQRLLIIVRDDDLAVYLAAQAREVDFDELSRRYFARMFQSLRF